MSMILEVIEDAPTLGKIPMVNPMPGGRGVQAQTEKEVSTTGDATRAPFPWY